MQESEKTEAAPVREIAAVKAEIRPREVTNSATMPFPAVTSRSTEAGGREPVGLTIRPAKIPPAAAAAPAKSATARSAASAERAEMPPAPQIQVTIGRVEVRAVAPTVAPAPRAKRDPGLSLENYLQRRAEGGRR